jgi:pilus assembly protein CpaE
MKAIVLSDSDTVGRRIRTAVVGSGAECSPADVLLLAEADSVERADVVVVSLLPDAARGLAAVQKVCDAGVRTVVAVGLVSDARLVLQAMRLGASDFIDEADLEGELAAALARAAAAVGKQSEPAKTIVVLGPSGGSGASTLAVNVATTLAAKHQSALLVDLKLHNGDLAALLDLKPAHNLAELCQESDQFDRAMFERSLAAHSSGVKLLAPPQQFADAALVSAAGVRQALSLGRALFPYVVVDVDNSFTPEQVQAVQLADEILLVLRLDFTCVRNARRTLEHLERIGVPKERVKVVANRFGQAKEVPAKQAEQVLGVKIVHYVPEDARTVNRANNNGTPVVQESPSAKVSKSLIELAVSVNGRATKKHQ